MTLCTSFRSRPLQAAQLLSKETGSEAPIALISISPASCWLQHDSLWVQLIKMKKPLVCLVLVPMSSRFRFFSKSLSISCLSVLPLDPLEGPHFLLLGHFHVFMDPRQSNEFELCTSRRFQIGFNEALNEQQVCQAETQSARANGICIPESERLPRQNQ